MNASLTRASNPVPTPVQRRYGIDESAWKLLAPSLPGRPGGWGGIARDNRAFIDAVFWVLRTGAPWRSLPPGYGDWKNIHRRFCRWRDKGLWESLLEVLLDDPDHAWLMTSHGTVHGGARALENQSAMHRNPRNQAVRYAWPWLRLVCRSEALLQKLPAHIHRLEAESHDDTKQGRLSISNR